MICGREVKRRAEGEKRLGPARLYVCEQRRSESPEVAEALAPAAQSVFDVHVDGKTLIYVKQRCAPVDTNGVFFLRVDPVDGGGASGGVKPATESVDFNFERHGAWFDGKCMATVPLPTWDIASVRTGQTDGFATTLWEVEIPFRGGAASPTGSAH